MVRAPDSWLKGRGFESWQKQRDKNCFIKGKLSVLTIISNFYLRVTAVVRKRSRSFCQKCRWQVTAKHACTLRMWLCMKWHGAWLYGVHRTRRDGSSFMWHQPCQRCKYTTSVDSRKMRYKTIHSCTITCKRSESARERKIALYKSDQQQHRREFCGDVDQLSLIHI